MSRTWDFFYPDVLPDVLGCPEPTVDRHLIRAARRLCAESRCWRESLDPILLTAGEAAYHIDYPKYAEGELIVGAVLDGVQIGVEGPDDTEAADHASGGRERVTSPDLVTVLLMPTPAASGGSLVLEAILKPTEAAESLPNEVADRYRSVIAGGALATLLKGNRAPWANPALAVDKEGEFRAAIAKARDRAWKGNTTVRKRTRAQFF